MKWFKFYGQDYLSDPKMLSLNACERSCWITLLSYGSVNDEGIIEYLNEEQLMLQAGISPTSEEWERTKGILKKFEEMNIVIKDNTKITLINWNERQETNLTGYERVKRWREKNSQQTNQMNQQYRSRRRNAEGSFTMKEWVEVKEKQKNICLMCHKKEPEIILTIDHIIPLSKGGENYISNIQGLCFNCNSSKKDTLFVIKDNEKITLEENRIEENRRDNTNTPAVADKVDPPIYSKEFLSFWNSYPNKKGKGFALKAWKKIKGVNNLTKKIIASVEEHITKDPQWKKDNGQFIPHPATFLNQTRWEDEIEVETVKEEIVKQY